MEPFNGKIPSDWIVSKLGDIASIKTNSFVPAKNSDAQLEHYSIPAYDDQKYPVFESATGVNIKYEITPRRPGDIAECYADPTKAETVLGWKAEKSLEDMCRDSWKFTQNNI